LDLDRLKSVNDIHGHGIGDAVLMRVAKKLLDLLRATDTVVRVTADKFLLLLPEMEQSHDAVLVADKALKSINEEMIFDTHKLHISVSMGISVYPDDTADSNELKRLADIALFQSKQEGGNRYLFYTENMNFHFQQRELLKHELVEALAKSQIELLFQPVIDITTQKIKVLESLLRWRHPYRGVLLPHQFLSIAVEAGLMLDISMWLVDRICQLLADSSKKAQLPKISINLSAYEFSSERLIDYIVEQVQRYSIAPGRLVLELQEHLLLTDDESDVQSKLTKLHNAGCSLWADDFWQAPLDLNRFILHHYDAVKMDMQIGNDNSPKYSACVDATVKMMNSLNIPVIHKNIETLVQMDLIKKIGGAWAQGFYLAKPSTLASYV
jgi:diguanylate cyclase (GGDEF)-like protein